MVHLLLAATWRGSEKTTCSVSLHISTLALYRPTGGEGINGGKTRGQIGENVQKNEGVKISQGKMKARENSKIRGIQVYFR